MHSFLTRMPRRASVMVATLAAAAGAIGCAAPLPAIAPERAVSDATGFEDAVTFLIAGEPVNVTQVAGDRLPLPEALRRAVAHDPGLQAALARVRAALADAEQARLLPNPVLSVLLRFPSGGGRPEIEAGITESLLALLTRGTRSEVADHRLRASVAEAVARALDTLAEARDRYVRIQSLAIALPLLRERGALLERLEAIARERLNAGEGTRLDVTTLAAQRAELDVEIAEAEAAEQDLRLELARRIGEPSGAARWALDLPATQPAMSLSEERLLSLATENRPEIQRIMWELHALNRERDLAGFSPWEGLALGVGSERTPTWSTGPAVTVPLPIFDRGSAAEHRANARLIEARHRLTEARRIAVEEVRRALEAYERTRQNLERTRTILLPLQRQRREQVEEVYRGGFADLTALLLAEQDLRATQARQVALEERAAIALGRLERAVGGPAAFLNPRASNTRALSPNPRTSEEVGR